MYNNLDSDAQDPDVIIKMDISNAFNDLCRYLSLDVLSGTASCDYASGLNFGDSVFTREDGASGGENWPETQSSCLQRTKMVHDERSKVLIVKAIGWHVRNSSGGVH